MTVRPPVAALSAVNLTTPRINVSLKLPAGDRFRTRHSCDYSGIILSGRVALGRKLERESELEVCPSASAPPASSGSPWPHVRTWRAARPGPCTTPRSCESRPIACRDHGKSWRKAHIEPDPDAGPLVGHEGSPCPVPAASRYGPWQALSAQPPRQDNTLVRAHRGPVQGVPEQPTMGHIFS
jgi:hypothetical protein